MAGAELEGSRELVGGSNLGAGEVLEDLVEAVHVEEEHHAEEASQVAAVQGEAEVVLAFLEGVEVLLVLVAGKA